MTDNKARRKKFIRMFLLWFILTSTMLIYVEKNDIDIFEDDWDDEEGDEDLEDPIDACYKYTKEDCTWIRRI